MDIQSMIKPVIDVQDVRVHASDEGWLQTDKEGMAFVKPLWTSPESGGWAVLFRWKAGYVAGAHKHLGAIHAFIVSGKLQVRDAVLAEGDYVYEANGVIHDETTALEDTVHLNIADGPVIFYDDSSLQGYFGWEQVEAIKQTLKQAQK